MLQRKREEAPPVGECRTRGFLGSRERFSLIHVWSVWYVWHRHRVPVILREDAGDSKTKGDYRCMEGGCGWSIEDAWRSKATGHVASCHPGRSSTVLRPREAGGGQSVEDREGQRKAVAAAAVKKCRQAAKVRGAGRQPQLIIPGSGCFMIHLTFYPWWL